MNTSNQPAPDYLIPPDNKSNTQIIDEIFQALNAQGGQCMNGLVCAYDNGLPADHPDNSTGTLKAEHCAIGFLLDPQTPEALADLQAYGGGIGDLISDILDDAPGSLGGNEAYMRHHLPLLTAAQLIHDWASPIPLGVESPTAPANTLQLRLDELANQLRTPAHQLPNSVLKWAKLRDPEFGHHDAPQPRPQKKEPQP